MVCSWAGSCPPLSVGILSRSSLAPSGREGSDTGQPMWSGCHWALTPTGLSQQQAAVRQGDLHLQEDGGGVSTAHPPPPPSGPVTGRRALVGSLGPAFGTHCPHLPTVTTKVSDRWCKSATRT